MSYREEGLATLRRRWSKQAVALAMQGRWREAVVANKSLIDSFPNDIDAYNRLGRAYMELGEYSQAREAYRRTLELDPYNAIAKKNLRRLSYLGEAIIDPAGDSDKAKPQHFIEEIGRSRVVNLYRLAPKEVLARVTAGDRVYLRLDGPDLIIENGRGGYLGQVEPKYGQRLIKLIKGGNKYSVAIVSSAEDRVTVIIREVYKDPSQAGQPSFPARGFEHVQPYIGDRIFSPESEHEEALLGDFPHTDDDKASDESEV